MKWEEGGAGINVDNQGRGMLRFFLRHQGTRTHDLCLIVGVALRNVSHMCYQACVEGRVRGDVRAITWLRLLQTPFAVQLTGLPGGVWW